MSKKAPASARKLDPRARRTQHSLGDALIELMHEKPFNAITVQDVLDRAHVGRSTFYTHFRDKDDLFLSDVDLFFESMATLLSRRGEPSSRVAPVREMFSHIAEEHKFYEALTLADKLQDVLELAQAHFARGIERRLAELSPTQAGASSPRAALAQALAGAMLSLLSWWIDRGLPMTPAQMDDLFHQMVWSGVSAAAGQPPSTAPL
jgi:AcrR family transcriptional regulator